jgi:hypothetical protein
MSSQLCTNASKHKWTWVKNITKTTVNSRSMQLSLRGFYHCSCGAVKVGRANHDGPDLRGLVGDGMFVAGATKELP